MHTMWSIKSNLLDKQNEMKLKNSKKKPKK